MRNSKVSHASAQALIAVAVLAALSMFVNQAVAQSQSMMTGMGSGSATVGEMNQIHELLGNHERIKRSVVNLADGIRTVTESDDPQVARTIQEHVAGMVQRVRAKSDPGLPDESAELHSIMKGGDKVRSTVEMTTKGAIVTQTSEDPATVVALQKHAAEVSDLVTGGMAAMQAAMMKNGGMMQGGMAGTANQQSATSAGSHDQHHADVNQKGDQIMGFDHEKTAHHFRLTTTGGEIEVTVNDAKDTVSLAQIRQHLSQVAVMFAAGNFSAPMLMHSQTPPGVPVMQQQKAKIKYRFEEVPRGGRIRITTGDRDGLVAVYEFLHFQIKEHATGDSGKIEKP